MTARESSVPRPVDDPPITESRADAAAIFDRHLHGIHVSTDRTMLVILLCQWLLAIVLALTFSPWAWAGKARSVHLHVWVALVLGGALNALPVWLILRRPGWWFTRQVVAVAQMLWSALLIHLTGGRIETHFHVFGSLAFLAFYRDWLLLPTATIVVAGDHLLRGLLLPESVYGTVNPEWWRFLEHAFWVIFEDIVLFLGCRRGITELQHMAEREAALADLNVTLEARVAHRTAELGDANVRLRDSVDQLQSMQKQLVEASHKAGMAEVATSVLHNVGNVLNSLNVSASVLVDTIRRSCSTGLQRATRMLEQATDPAAFLTQDDKGRHLPRYLSVASEEIRAEQERMLGELESLQRSIDHITVIVGRQQAHAKSRGVVETLSLSELLEDAVKFNAASCERHDVEVTREFQDVGLVELDRHKLFQIVMNLLSNARQALREAPEGVPRRIVVRLERRGDDSVAIEVQDNGCGIPAENLTRIFNHGFTTKSDGHGFGLHSSACSAMEMGATLSVRSDGPGCGATFTILLPVSVPRVEFDTALASSLPAH